MVTIWLYGLPCSGKTTLAKHLKTDLMKLGHSAVHLDGDILRSGLCRDLGFSPEERGENLRRAAECAKLINASGLISICSFITPQNQHRELITAIIGEKSLIDVFVDTPLSVCELRDTKMMYKRAKEGLLKNFTGINAPFDYPQNPTVHLVHQYTNLEGMLRQLIATITQRLKV